MQFYRKVNRIMLDKIKIEYLHDNQVVRLTLNAPKANILDAEMMTQLQTCFEEFKDRQDLKLIQFIGEGDHFSFGASVAEHAKEKAPQMLRQFHSLFYSAISDIVSNTQIILGMIHYIFIISRLVNYLVLM